MSQSIQSRKWFMVPVELATVVSTFALLAALGSAAPEQPAWFVELLAALVAFIGFERIYRGLFWALLVWFAPRRIEAFAPPD